jgi:hypothetical protein
MEKKELEPQGEGQEKLEIGEGGSGNADIINGRDRDESQAAAGTECSIQLETIPEFLGKKIADIEKGLDGYCENPTAVVFMQIYTCIYDLCNGRAHKNAVCRAVYELYRREIQAATKQLVMACQKLATGLDTTSSLQRVSSEVLLEWQRLERRFHALQASFGYLDRYYVPRASLDNLSTLRLATMEQEGLEREAQQMWKVLAVSLRDGYASISFQRMHQLAEAWGTLTHVAGMEESAAASGACEALQEHLAVTFTEGHRPLGRPGNVSGSAIDRVLGMQRPLVRVIIEFLSEQDLCKVYSVKSMQRST